MATKKPVNEGGEKNQREKSPPSYKQPRNKERGSHNNQLQSYSKLDDIKVFRTGLSAAVFEEWKRGFLIVLRVLYGDLATSLTDGEYYRPHVPSYLAFCRKRTAELQADEEDDQSRAGSSRPTRSTRARGEGGTQQTTSSQPTAAATSDGSASASTATTGGQAINASEVSLAARISKMVDNEYDDLVKIAKREEKTMEGQRVAMQASIWGKMYVCRESPRRGFA